MAARQARTYTAEEVARIVMDVPADSDVSDFEGEEGDHESDMDESDTDSDESYNSASEIEHEAIPPLESDDSESDFQRNETTTSTRRRSSRGRSRGRGARRTASRGARSRSPTNRRDENNSAIRWGNLDENVVVSFPEYTGQHGPVTLLEADSEPVNFFSLVFPEELWDILVEQTNLYVAQKQRKTWLCDTNKDEMKAFVGALYFMALHRLPNFDHYFSRDWVFAVPAMQSVFTRNRFWQLWQNFHLADNTRQPAPTDDAYDKLYKLRPMINGMKEKFEHSYNIGQKVCVDEHMVKGKGRNPFKQYLPMKPIKRGTKIWELACSCCGYLYDFQVYTGKSGGNAEKGLAHRVVTDLVAQLQDRGTVLYIDNFFTSIPLLQELSELSISVVGTIRNNRKDYPKALQDKNLLKQMKRGEFHTVASETTVCTVWKDTKHVSFLSNVHSSHGNCTITRKLRRGEQVDLPCPPCAVDYNKNMGAVDRHDQMVRNYAIDRKSRRWWVRMFVNFLDAIMVNAYIVYKENFRIMNMPPPQKTPKPLSHDKFMAGVIHKLIGNFSCRRQPGPAPAMPPPPFHGRDHDSVNVADLGLLKFGRCHHCCIGVKGAKRKETGFGCRSCMKRLCRSGCHEEYHRQNNIF